MYLKRYKPDKEFWSSKGAWEAITILAREHGWEPEGTEWDGWFDPDDPLDEQRQSELAQLWDGSYFSNEGQFVNEGDAKNLFSALEKAKEEIESQMKAEIVVNLSDRPFLLRLDQLSEFLEFCGGEEFAIW